MTDDRGVTRWQDLAREAFEGLDAWRATHPRATFAQMEEAVEERVGALRAAWLEELTSARAGEPCEAEAGCPKCGGALHPRGTHTRVVTIRGNHSIHLKRPYMSCPACQAGLFPPG